MDPLRFETPEDVDLEFRPAGPATRFTAYVVDLITLYLPLLLALFFVIIMLAFSPFGFDWTAGILVALAFVVNGFSQFVYFFLWEMKRAGVTPGKRNQKIVVVMNGGYALTPSAALIRNLFRVIDAVPLFWLVPLIDRQRRRLGDFAAGTLVVSAFRRELPPLPLAEQSTRVLPVLHLQLTRPDLQKLEIKDLEGLEEYLHRAPSLPREARKQIEHTMLRSLLKRLERFQPPAVAEDVLLKEIYLSLREFLDRAG